MKRKQATRKHQIIVLNRVLGRNDGGIQKGHEIGTTHFYPFLWQCLKGGGCREISCSPHSHIFGVSVQTKNLGSDMAWKMQAPEYLYKNHMPGVHLS